ncbi:hypothetical protein [Methylocaldum szegediense]|uniref:Uncharacterized protein n=1 Tax=Methylocaldum szegediense TaxID=73780 RepID=A0ABM9I578_9GAMM|nr:hypothetical protein [Methylocaldum szegediense]CAI8900495.1 protein of unknown function [Methylocaldum szegediense]
MKTTQSDARPYAQLVEAGIAKPECLDLKLMLFAYELEKVRSELFDGKVLKPDDVVDR